MMPIDISYENRVSKVEADKKSNDKTDHCDDKRESKEFLSELLYDVIYDHPTLFLTITKTIETMTKLMVIKSMLYSSDTGVSKSM